MAGLHDIPVLQMRYDTQEYDFRGVVENILGPDLERIHCALGNMALRTRETDQKTDAHRMFYDGFDRVEETYRQFIRGFVEPLFQEPVVFQRVPTFRVHLPGNLAVGEHHRDSDYNHNPNAVTFWLPVTDACGSSSVHIELDGKMRPTYVPYGHVLVFDSMNLKHGNEVNTTPDSRVSMDFRIIPKSKFIPSDKESLNTHLKMDIGGYYAD